MIGEVSPFHSKSIPGPSSGSQFSTAKIAFDVTNNLYPGYRERTLGACADPAANRWRAWTFTTKPPPPLQRVTPFVTRLCPQTLWLQDFTGIQQGYLVPNPCIRNTLRKQREKNCRITSSFRTDQSVLTGITTTTLTAARYMLAHGSPATVQSRRGSIP